MFWCELLNIVLTITLWLLTFVDKNVRAIEYCVDRNARAIDYCVDNNARAIDYYVDKKGRVIGMC